MNTLSEQLKNYMRLAENAYNIGNFEEAYVYSTKILEQDPDNWLATIIKGVSITGTANMANPRFDAMIATVRTVIHRIPEEAMKSVAEKFAGFAISYYEYFSKSKRHGIEAQEEYLVRVLSALHLLGLAFITYPNLEYAVKINEIYCNLINRDSFGENFPNCYKETDRYIIIQMEYIESIVVKYVISRSPDLTIPLMDNQIAYMKEFIEASEQKKKQKKKGCFIATAVYGDYNAPEVCVLRCFRDNVLDKSALGRMFIRTYYAISPSIANWLRTHDEVSLAVKKLLDKFVAFLRSRK